MHFTNPLIAAMACIILLNSRAPYTKPYNYYQQNGSSKRFNEGFVKLAWPIYSIRRPYGKSEITVLLTTINPS